MSLKRLLRRVRACTICEAASAGSAAGSVSSRAMPGLRSSAARGKGHETGVQGTMQAANACVDGWSNRSVGLHDEGRVAISRCVFAIFFFFFFRAAAGLGETSRPARNVRHLALRAPPENLAKV